MVAGATQRLGWASFLNPVRGVIETVANRLRYALPLLLGLLLAGGCEVNPITGGSAEPLISPAQEVALGAQQYLPAQQSQGGRYYIDPALQDYVTAVGRRLAAVSDRAGLPYEFVVLNNPVPNAWALPGGKIAINAGLLPHLEDEAQLAAVLSHQIAHTAARHGATQLSRDKLLNMGVQLADAHQGGFVAPHLGAQAWMARYSRQEELEADIAGMEYLSRAGYDPLAAVELQETFLRLGAERRDDFASGLFASHPPSRERLRRSQQKATTLPAGGARNRDLHQQRIAPLRHDQPAYEAQWQAIGALNDGHPQQALEALDRAIAIQPRDGYFRELRGHALHMLGDIPAAEREFSAAINRNPSFFSHHLARGLLRHQDGRRDEAAADLRKSHQLLPTPPSSYFLGEYAERAGDITGAIAYYQLAAQADGGLGREARHRLVNLEMVEAPHKYLSARLRMGEDNTLLVVVSNNSPIAVTGVRVRLGEMVSNIMMGNTQDLAGPARLSPGEQAVVPTGIALADAGEVSRYRTQVVSATPAS